MRPDASPPPTREVETDPRSRRFWFWLLTVSLFVGFSLGRWPLPGINETHYLSKAKHFADPAWCAGDFFLDSSNPHAATSWLLGQLTCRFSFETSALAGRLLALGVLAWGWTMMLCGTLASWKSRILASAIFLLLHILGNWSGEWLLRGVEGKVFAWGFLFLAIGLWTRDQPIRAGAALGAAVTFHPVIGAWGAVAAGLSIGWNILDRRRSRAGIESDRAGSKAFVDSDPLPRSQALALAALLFCLMAAPGIIAALPALRLGTPDQRWQADHIQVTQRLGHHLDPARFLWSSHREYLLMLATLVLLPRRRPRPWLERMAWMSVLCAAGGILISLWPRTPEPFPLYVLRLKLLKLYPFRLMDVFVPLLVAVRFVELPALNSLTLTARRVAATSVTLVALAWFWPGDEGPARRMSPADFQHWKVALTWIKAETPADAVIQSMNEDFAVKWFAERAEFVNYKDCPQDAPGILEWHRRLTQLDQEWRLPAMRDMRVTPEELHQLHALTGIDYLVCSRFGPIEANPVFAEGPFRVYAIAPVALPSAKRE